MPDRLNPSADALFDRLQALLQTLQMGLTGSNPAIAIPVLENAARQLNALLPMLQFEKMDAEEAGDWEQVDELDRAIAECQSALNTVQAAILRARVIGVNPQDLSEMQQIRRQMDTAARTQRRLQTVIRVVGLIRRIAGRTAGL